MFLDLFVLFFESFACVYVHLMCECFACVCVHLLRCVSTVCVGTLCMSVSPVCMFMPLVCEFFTCVCKVYVTVSCMFAIDVCAEKRLREAIGSSRSGVMDGCELPGGAEYLPWVFCKNNQCS